MQEPLSSLLDTCMCTCEKKQELSRQETARHLMYFFLFEIASSRQLSDPKGGGTLQYALGLVGTLVRAIAPEQQSGKYN